MRRLLWSRLHRYIGLATALFLAIAGLTGALLAYYEPLSAWLSPEIHHAPGRGAALTPLELLERARAAEPRAEIRDIVLNLREGEGARYYVTPKVDPATNTEYDLGYDALWLDPVTGAVLGRIDSDAMPPTRHSLMSFIYRLHYELALPGQWGVWIMGIAALLWFFDCFIAAYLTFPRTRPVWPRWKHAWGVAPQRFNYDLHRASGLWLWGLLATLALSSVYFNLNDEVFMPVYGKIADVSLEPFDTRPERPPDARIPAAVSAQQAMDIGVATTAELGWTNTAEFMRHRSNLGVWQIYYEKPTSQWATAGGYSLFIDDQSGEVIYVRAPGGTAGDVFLDWIVALHLGTVFGQPYKLLLCIVGLAIAVLSWTGVVIWLRKRRSEAAQRSRNARGANAAQELKPLEPPAHTPRPAMARAERPLDAV